MENNLYLYAPIAIKGYFLGVTKSMQEVQLTKKVKLLDSPGLVMAGGNRNDASVALRNAVKVSKKSCSLISCTVG